MSSLTMIKIREIDGILCVELGGELIGCLQRGGDGWGFLKFVGKQAGGFDTYATLQAAIDRARRYIPWHGEGSY